jgi:hypothetical protein
LALVFHTLLIATDMRIKQIVFITACSGLFFNVNAQQQAPTDRNIGIFNILKTNKAIEMPAEKALILLKPEIQLGDEVLTCDSAYFTLGKKFEAFGHVKIKETASGKVVNKEYVSVTIIENSAYFKNSMVTR